MRSKIPIGLSLSLLFAGCAYHRQAEETNAPSIKRNGKFSHAQHGSLYACLDCHASALTGKHAGMPAAKLTVKDKPPCAMCHKKPYTAPTGYPRKLGQEIFFDHGRHADSAESCSRCHGDVKKAATMAEVEVAGAKKDCAVCHGKDVGDPKKCATCHRNHALRRPLDHGRSWLRLHGDVFRGRVFAKPWYRCKSCHEEASCNACHKHTAPRDHNEIWRRRSHGLAAEVDRLRCRTCHTESVCVRCHSTAPPWPRNTVHVNASAFGCTDRCHLGAHGFGGQDCRACHK